MKYLIAALILTFPLVANAACTYEARVRLGLIWHDVSITSDVPLTRKEVIYVLSKKYNFHDVGDIYSNCKNP